jgi:LPXTG-motif cell wall-anchored protein
VRLVSTTASRRLLSGCVVAGALIAAVVTSGAIAAAADAGWSRVPASGIGGGTVDVASSATTLCQWTQPAPTGGPPLTPGDPGGPAPTVPGGATTPGGDTVYDGTGVRVRLAREGVDVPLGTLAVTQGGAWSGTVTLPGTDRLVPGEYLLFVTCVIDRPELDGVRTYDFYPLPFTVVEAPPPTTVEVPVELVPPITAVNPVQVQGEQITRGATAAPAGATAASPTLPNTGDGTLETAAAGIGALLVGGAALWWGARHGRRHPPADLAD